MADNYEDKRRKTSGVLHSVYDYVMGALWFCLGGFFLLHNKLGVELAGFDDTLLKIFGGAAVLYGGFRLYRGYRKNY